MANHPPSGTICRGEYGESTPCPSMRHFTFPADTDDRPAMPRRASSMLTAAPRLARVPLLAGLLLVAGALQATAADVVGWRAARWGMTDAELVAAFGSELKRLPGRWQYGGAYAERALFDVELGGLKFMALFQMNQTTDRLQQVLLERRGAQATPAAYDRMMAALEAAYGPAEGLCLTPHPDGPLRRFSLRWRFATTTIQATWLDFLTTALLFEEPDTERRFDPLVPSFETRRIVRRFLPRRVLVRFQPSQREDLQGWQSCADGKSR